MPDDYQYLGAARDSTNVRDKTLANLTSSLLSEELIKGNTESSSDNNVAFKILVKICFVCNSAEHFAQNRPKDKNFNHNRRWYACNNNMYLVNSCNTKPFVLNKSVEYKPCGTF